VLLYAVVVIWTAALFVRWLSAQGEAPSDAHLADL
jgi:hypothetical protein